MDLGALHMRLNAGDLGLERFDPFLQLCDGQRVEVLLRQRDQRIVGLAREEIVEVHGRIFDPCGRGVNKRGAVTSIPPTMKAAVAPQPDGAEELALIERPVPTPGPGEVLVRVAAAGVNRPDILQRRGLYPPPPGAPDILGLEIAGEVVAGGEGESTLIGEQVCALVAGGGYAEYCLAPTGTCLPIPSLRK